MNTHQQIHAVSSFYSTAPFNDTIKVSDKDYHVTNIIGIDQFFSQPHNIRNGFVDCSVYSFNNPQAVTHVSPVSAETPMSVKMTDDEIHSNVVSKSCQTLSELSQLSKLKPTPEQFDEIENQPIETPPSEPQPAESASDN